ncbi:hypothetical protein D3C80_1922150 [compost metagenome]
MNNPLLIWTEKIATNKSTTNPSAAGRTSNPMTNASPPKNSMPPDIIAIKCPGARPMLSMYCAVPVKP